MFKKVQSLGTNLVIGQLVRKMKDKYLYCQPVKV